MQRKRVEFYELMVLDISRLSVRTLSKSKENHLLQLEVKMNQTKKMSLKKKNKLLFMELVGGNLLTVPLCPSSFEKYLSVTSIVNSDNQQEQEDDEDIDEAEAQKAYRTLYNKCLEVDKLN